MWKDYYQPKTLQEALDILSHYQGRARVIAGGTDLLLDLKKGNKKVEYLVDIRGIEDLKKIEEKNDNLFIGAAVTHNQLSTNLLIREKAAALAQGAAAVGSLQVRNIGTIGGNIVNAQPAADTAIPLVAFEAQAEIAEINGGKRVEAVESLYMAPGKSKLDSTSAILTGFYLPVRPPVLSAFDRMARRKSLSLPMLNLAVVLRTEGNVLKYVRIAAGPVAPKPQRLINVEKLLEGQVVTPELLAEAARCAGETANPRDSLLRGPRAFRKEMLGIMLTRTLLKNL